MENCTLCHAGQPGMKTRVHNSTLERLVTPPDAAGQQQPTFDQNQ